MRLMLLLLVAVVIQPPLVRGAMNGTLCPLYFAVDYAIYVVNVDTTNTDNVTYRTPTLLTTTPNTTSLNFSYSYRHYPIIIYFKITCLLSLFIIN